MKKTKLFKRMVTLAISAAMLLSATLAFAEAEQATEDSIAVTAEADENGFVIENNVLIGYEGSDYEVVIPDGVTEIGAGAFSGSGTLMKVTIPDSVATIGDRAFSNCWSLTDINVSSGNSIYASVDGCLYTKDKTKILICPLGKTEVDIADSVTNISDYTFSNCFHLTKMDIPNSVTDIGNYAFSQCTGLAEVTIPNSVTDIGKFAFYDCRSLTSVVISDGVTSIGSGAFYACSALTEISIPGSVTNIGQSAFTWCTNLISINVASGNNTYTSADGCVYTKDKTKLLICPEGKTKVTILDSVTSIGDEAFNLCAKLTEVILPDGVTSIGDSAFSDCRSLTELIIPYGATSIGDDVFYWNTSLKKVVIPETVTSIGDMAFNECSATIYGIAGSYAETYAKEHDIPFIALSESSSAIDKESTSAAYTKGSSEGATIKCLWDLADFLNVYVDGTLIDKSNYTLEEGSTIIKFTQSFMDTLSAGEHVFTLEYTGDRKVDVSMTIAEAEKKQADGSTKTGDTGNMFLWIVLALASAGCILNIRKKVQTF